MAMPAPSPTANGLAANSGTDRKRKQKDALHVCAHLPRDGEQWLRRQLADKLPESAAEGHPHHRRHHLSALAQAIGECLRHTDDTNDTTRTGPVESLCHERYACLSCEYVGAREDAANLDSFMTHAILTSHHLALVPRLRQLYCASCRDFIYPDALLTHTQFPANDRKLMSSNRLSTPRKRRPCLPRRVLRVSSRRGLVNMGNTCYMNAVLQALAHNSILQHEYFALRSHKTTICEQSRHQQQQQQQQQQRQQQQNAECGATTTSAADDADATLCNQITCLACELSALMHKLFPAPRTPLLTRLLASPVVPQTMLETFWAYDRSFVSAKQQDAHEFLLSLLSGLHKHTHPRVPVPVPVPMATMQASESLTTNASMSPRFTATGASLCDCVVHQSFAGVLKSEVTCAFCRNVSGTYDPFLDLSLSLDGIAAEDAGRGDHPLNGNDHAGTNGTKFSLASLLRRFIAEERLKGVDQVYCRRCSRYVDASKRLVCHALPNMLVLHLKRLDFHKQRKIADAVSFPVQGLDLQEFCSTERNDAASSNAGALTDTVYDLAAVISHHGDSIAGGHFTAYVRSSRESTAGTEAEFLSSSAVNEAERTQWLHFDDCDVSSVSSEQVAQSQAYMLWYARRQVCAS